MNHKYLILHTNLRLKRKQIINAKKLIKKCEMCTILISYNQLDGTWTYKQ